ncbi:transporter associated domain-containing protein [Rhizobium sp. TH2]|uniref:transporter associated domain-containing protein n=1 Tax=Rhizobium sp. TH2 TaxID=2775403 RepID=UPI00215864BE|nr:transporter associated domain-containing protein [Rhizobium sp. TH2]
MNWLARFAAWLGRLAGNGQTEPRRLGNGGDAQANAPRDNNGNGSSRERDSWQELDEREISDVMIHRTVMKAINADDPPEVAVRTILDSAFTRMPVWKDETDNIVGIIHAKDILRALTVPGSTPEMLDIMKIADRPWFVPDTTSMKDQLAAFLHRNTHFAVVVDEYGEVQGMITMQDILEEVLGDISDEHQPDLSGVRREADGSVVVDGAVSIRDLNRALGWALPDEDATTIAGLVIYESRSIPEERSSFTFHGKRFIVMKRVKNRITRLRIRPADEVLALTAPARA